MLLGTILIMKVEVFVVICLTTLILIPCIATTEIETSGPYRAKIVKVQKCNTTTYPIDKDPPILLHLEVYQVDSKHSLLRGNHTVVKENNQVKHKVRSFVWRNEMWKETFIMNNLGCHSILLDSILKMLNLKYDRERCGFIKGTHIMPGFDVDKFQHMWTSEAEYGKLLWINEAIKGSTTYYCWELETLITPLDK